MAGGFTVLAELMAARWQELRTHMASSSPNVRAGFMRQLSRESRKAKLEMLRVGFVEFSIVSPRSLA
jgi:hypothetical protein